mgnify:CR=1 FL=1
MRLQQNQSFWSQGHMEVTNTNRYWHDFESDIEMQPFKYMWSVRWYSNEISITNVDVVSTIQVTLYDLILARKNIPLPLVLILSF